MAIKTETNSLKALYDLGQSAWYDNIDRRLLRDGRLKNIVDQGIMGLTSNPSIFQKALSASDIYKEDIDCLKSEGKSPKEIYDKVTIADVRGAADILRSVYDKTKGVDGYVSIEVYPEYAHNTEKTIGYAKMIYKEISRPNIMIKVPGTKEGCEAVRSLVSEGISVNVTLLFSLSHYDLAAKAYIEGLRDRVKKGRPIDKVASVASVFISRIDTKIDKMLDEKNEGSLKGKAAVSNTKLIYQHFKKIFDDKNFNDLKNLGGQVQRPLWASTSTKNPAYNDLKYVEELVARDSINTLPHATMEALLDHGKPSLCIEDGVNEAKKTIESLNRLGIDISNVCREIQDTGIDAFQESFDKLIEEIEK